MKWGLDYVECKVVIEERFIMVFEKFVFGVC